MSLRACVPGGRAAMISSCRSLPRDVRAVGRKAPSVYRAGTRDGSIYILSTYQSSFRQVFFFLEGSEVCLSLYISISYKLGKKGNYGIAHRAHRGTGLVVTAVHLRRGVRVGLLGSSCGECGMAALFVALDIRSHAALSAVEHEMTQIYSYLDLLLIIMFRSLELKHRVGA